MKPEQPFNHHDPVNVVKTLQRMYKILRRNVSYGTLQVGDSGQNIDGYPTTATTPGTANVDFAVSHGLNRIPVGFHVMNKNASTDVYQGVGTWTSDKIYLRATGTGVKLTIFIF